jgi:RecA-family ATPase
MNNNNDDDSGELQIFDSVQVTERFYCWTPYIPKRCVTLLQGDPQTAKSTIIRAVAAALSNGSPLPPNDEKNEPMRVLLQNAEDDFSSMIVPHLKKLGANMSNIARINEDNAPLFFYDERIENYINLFRPQLVIFDTLQRYGNVNLNDLTAVTALFDYLNGIAKRYDCGLVVVSHLNKSDGKTEYKGFGRCDTFCVIKRFDCKYNMNKL